MNSNQAPSKRRLGRWKMILILLACASPVIASYITYYFIRPEGRTNYATLIQPARPIPSDLTLKTLDGNDYATHKLKGQWLLLTVSTSNCDTACEERLYMQRQLREMLGRERDRVEKVWLIAHDHAIAPRLQQALASTPAMHIFRVNPSQLSAWLEPQIGQPLDQHLYVIDPMGHWMMRTPSLTQPEKFKRDLEKLLRASSFWDKADTATKAQP